MDIRTLTLGARRPLLLSHCQPDGDAVGSILGLGHALRAAGQCPISALPEPVPESLAFLPGATDIRSSLVGLPDGVDLIFVLDCGRLDRLKQLYDEHQGLFARLPVINIDHHLGNPSFGTANLVDTSWAAVAEELYFLITDLGLPLIAPAASCLLAGIITDTQSFRTPNTTSRTLQAAAGLVEAGAPLAEVTSALHRTASPSSLRLWGLALSTLQSRDGLLWASVSQSMLVTCSATSVEADGLIDLLCMVRDTAGVLLFREEGNGTVRVSLRSLDDRLNVAEIAARFGGGGHARAAGCHVNAGLLEAQAQVLGYTMRALRGAPV
ncbi:MAG: DHHA1 domain-containing protein [Bacteroidetes bacterium]|nr:DHHA1 domain-containing protein [Bacteroidota bacterium]MCL5025296.1 DHHA1 domain-containing protein [Chloroflexota bacterium]